MRVDQVEEFWKIYHSKKFKLELEHFFQIVESFKKFKELSFHYSLKSISLIVNKSPSYISKSLKIYSQYFKSLKLRQFSKNLKIHTVLVRLSRFQKLYNNFKESKMTIGDLLNLNRFWEIPLKKCGPKDFAFLYYCLDRQGLEIKNARWCRKL